jgi:prephenate dehydrogenase
MTTQITILGLDLLGKSLGLALSARDFPVMGFDPKVEVAQEAQKLGMVRQFKWNMAHAVEHADLTLVCLPLGDQREVLAALAADFQPGSTVVSVTPLLSSPLAWAAEVLGADRHFLALHPLLGPATPYSEDQTNTPRADLFWRGLWAMAPSATCAPAALQLVNGLAKVAGALPYFVDPVEHDGLMGGVSALPVMLAWALMRAATTSTGWTEMRKVADYSFATATAALANVDQAAETFKLNRDAALRYLDAAQAELKTLREKIASDDAEALAEALAEAADRRAAWLADSVRGDWEAPERPAPDMPTSGDTLRRFLLGGLLDRKKK